MRLGRQVFADRAEAGRALAQRLRGRAGEHPVVMALPRGGVPVAAEVARALDAPLDIIVVRKIGAPGNPELGIGAVAEGDVRIFNRDALSTLLISPEELTAGAERAAAEVDELVRRYRDGRAPVELEGRTVIVVDDGLATGGTARAALRVARARGAARVILAVPVGAPATVAALRPEADEIVCLQQPENLWAVGYWYGDFRPVADDEVRRALARDSAHDAAPTPDPPAVRAVEIPLPAGGALPGDLTLAENATGLVVFAHGSGSSRHSPRNRQVAQALNERGLATLLFDLLTPAEEHDRANVFDIGLLARRLVAVTRWAATEPDTARLAVGYFGASTGAAAALCAAAELGADVRAVVSRGGRPDLAGPRLGEVRAPVLLIVGGADRVVLGLNEEARAALRCDAQIEVVPGATHLFEEPGALERVAELAAQWFDDHLTRADSRPLARSPR